MSLPEIKEEDIKWRKDEREKDKTFVDLEIGESLAGTLASKNKGFFGMYYIFEKFDGSIAKLNGTTNLNKWMAKYEPGDLLRITRKDDLKSPDPEKNNMKIFEVEKGEVSNR